MTAKDSRESGYWAVLFYPRSRKSENQVRLDEVAALEDPKKRGVEEQRLTAACLSKPTQGAQHVLVMET